MKKRIFILCEVILAICSIVFFFMGAVQLSASEGQVEFARRGNVIGVCFPLTNFICNKSVLADPQGNLYVSGLGGDTCVIQKFTPEGKYVCSYTVADSRAFKYFISEDGDLQVYGNGKLYEYQNDQLVALTELTESESEEIEESDQASEGKFTFWTVHMNDGKEIHLEKIFSFYINPMYMFQISVLTLLLLAAAFQDNLKE